MRRLEFPISPKAIANGVANNSNHCIIAEAIKEAYPDLQFVSVDLQTIRATDRRKGERYVWFTPRVCQRLLISFDQGSKPQPIPTVRLQYGQVIPAGRQGIGKSKKKKAPTKKTLQKRGNSLPIIRGGKAPPIARSRREFGIRALG